MWTLSKGLSDAIHIFFRGPQFFRRFSHNKFSVIIENTSLKQQDKYIFHLYVFFSYLHYREPLPYLNVYSSVTPDDG